MEPRGNEKQLWLRRTGSLYPGEATKTVLGGEVKAEVRIWPACSCLQQSGTIPKGLLGSLCGPPGCEFRVPEWFL